MRVLCFFFDVCLLWGYFRFPASSDESLAFFPLIATAALGLFSAFQSYQGERATADAMKDQAELDRKVAEEQRALDSKKASDEAERMRDKQRHRRSAIEAGYAASGVVLEGSASDVLTEQRETDEMNVQRHHASTNDQLNKDRWAANNKYEQSMYSARVKKSMAKMSLFTDVATVGAGAAFGSPSSGFGGTNGGASAWSKFSSSRSNKALLSNGSRTSLLGI